MHAVPFQIALWHSFPSRLPERQLRQQPAMVSCDTTPSRDTFDDPRLEVARDGADPWLQRRPRRPHSRPADPDARAAPPPPARAAEPTPGQGCVPAGVQGRVGYGGISTLHPGVQPAGRACGRRAVHGGATAYPASRVGAGLSGAPRSHGGRLPWARRHGSASRGPCSTNTAACMHDAGWTQVRMSARA